MKPGERGVSSQNNLSKSVYYSPFSSMALEAVLFVLELVLDSSSKSPAFSSCGEVEQKKLLKPASTRPPQSFPFYFKNIFVTAFYKFVEEFLKSNYFLQLVRLYKEKQILKAEQHEIKLNHKATRALFFSLKNRFSLFLPHPGFYLFERNSKEGTDRNLQQISLLGGGGGDYGEAIKGESA